jgi:hypothetical protein
LLQAIVAFASGIMVALIGAVVAAVVQRKVKHRRHIEETQFQVYMKLLNVYNLYFWVASLEMTSEEVDPDHKRQIRDCAWRIADLLRSEDDVPFADEILRVLMSNEYVSASARHHVMSLLVDKLGASVNPRYQRAIKAISEANVMRIGLGEQSPVKSTTPASMGPL